MRTWVLVVLLPLLALTVAMVAASRSKTQLTWGTSSDVKSPANAIARPSVQRVSGAVRLPSDPLVSPIISVKTFAEPVKLPTRVFDLGERAIFHPHGDEVCASGCAASRHPTDQLTEPHFHTLLQKYATEPMATAGPACDELLYFGRQTSRLLLDQGYGPLDPVRVILLKQELQLDHAEVEIRVVDASGQTRASLPPTRVPLDRRHEFELDTHNLQPMIASGTVKRVGRDYVWARL